MKRFHADQARGLQSRGRRRAVLALAALGLTGVTGCVRKAGSEPRALPRVTEARPPQVPFGSRPHGYAVGSILPTATPAELDRATRSFYDYWKAKYVRPGCGEGELVVEARTKPTNLTVSEAHGYGMIITAYMAGHDPDAKHQFDAMLRYHRRHQSALTPGIMAWYQDQNCRDTGGDNLHQYLARQAPGLPGHGLSPHSSGVALPDSHRAHCTDAEAACPHQGPSLGMRARQ